MRDVSHQGKMLEVRTQGRLFGRGLGTPASRSLVVISCHSVCVAANVFLCHGDAIRPFFVVSTSSSILPCVIASVRCLRGAHFYSHVQMLHSPSACSRFNALLVRIVSPHLGLLFCGWEVLLCVNLSLFNQFHSLPRSGCEGCFLCCMQRAPSLQV